LLVDDGRKKVHCFNVMVRIDDIPKKTI